MRAPPRLARLSRQLFDCRRPATAEWLALQAGIRSASARHLLRLLERSGQAERYWGERGRDGRRVEMWRWKE